VVVVPLFGSYWEDLPYLDRIWTLKQLPWQQRPQLLETHTEGILIEGDLSLAALRSLGSSGLDREAMGQVLLESWELVSARHSPHSLSICIRRPGAGRITFGRGAAAARLEELRAGGTADGQAGEAVDSCETAVTGPPSAMVSESPGQSSMTAAVVVCF
jgi:hypothetical protein